MEIHDDLSNVHRKKLEWKYEKYQYLHVPFFTRVSIKK